MKTPPSSLIPEDFGKKSSTRTGSTRETRKIPYSYQAHPLFGDIRESRGRTPEESGHNLQ